MLVLAGDLAPACAKRMRRGRHGALEWARRQAGDSIPIVAVMGNHDYSFFPYLEVVDALQREATEWGVHFLHNSSIDVQGVRFLGTPLFMAPGLAGVDRAECDAVIGRKARITPSRATETCICGTLRPPCALEETIGMAGPLDAAGMPWDAAQFYAENRLARAFLARELARDEGVPKVVVTHWAPSLRSLPLRETRPRAAHAYWGSDHEDLVAQANLWVHGHIHDTCDYRIGGDPKKGRVVANPHGNAADAAFLNPHYDPQLIVRLGE